MANIFNKQIKTNSGGFSVDSAKLNFPGLSSGTGGSLLVQSVQIQYNQQLTFLYDLSDPKNVYYVAGRAEGTLGLGKAVGSAGLVKNFYATYGDVCKASTNSSNTVTLDFNTNCSGNAPTSTGAVTLYNPIIVSFGLQMTVDQGIIGENVSMRFSDLEIQ
jgi:hypothetical protein